MSYAIVCQAKTSKFFCIGIENNLVCSVGNQKTIVCKRPSRIEIENEDIILTTVCQYLVTVIMPYFNHRSILYILHLSHRIYQTRIKITQIMLTQVFIVYQVPLATCIFMRPSITFAREVNPFRMTELITHKV